jgi:cytochrome P450
MNQPRSAGTAAATPPEPETGFELNEGDGSLVRMCELNARFGDIYRVFSPARRGYVYVINHPDDVKRVLVVNHGNYRKGFGLDRVKMLLGLGLVTSDGDLWRTQRYMMQPMFHRRVVAQFDALIDAVNDRLLARWERKAAGGEAVNVTDEMSEVTLDFILRAIFGSDLDRLTQQNGQNPFHVITEGSARDLAFASKVYQLRKLVLEIARRRRSETAQEGLDLIGLLVAARDKASGAPMGDRELVDEVMTLIIAGHETAASGLNSAWYLLSQHPEAEAKLQREIDGHAAAPSSLKLSESLVYTRRVIDEALRLYPPVWVMSRQSIGPDRLAGYDIPAGVELLLSPYLVHRHPKFWSEPERFDPEREEPVAEGGGSLFARIPFGAGARRCIGESLGLYEMSMLIYRVARRFRLTHPPAPPMELEAQINLRTRRPIYMQLEPRQ